ncbi:MAG TPA: rRNA small subunit methyltransferase 1, partial [Burkholderiaceae bacterium]|nr:rRNA small subunit methyltransferase 1 [Burkholderiaceae bacterium]
MNTHSQNMDWVQRADLSAQHWPQAALYVVATPIGNLADITLRALWVLSHADAIAAEDTRVAQQLLSRYGMAQPPQGWIRAHTHAEREAGEHICALLARGARVALVSDAGTPALSDPGARVVQAVREAGFVVQPIAGPSSALAALSVAGFCSSDFTFLGFLPT